MTLPPDAEANTPGRVPTEIAVELFGVPRLLTGRRILTAHGETLEALTNDLAVRWPALLGQVIDPATGWLVPGYIFVVNECFTVDARTPLSANNSVLLVSSVAGG